MKNNNAVADKSAYLQNENGLNKFNQLLKNNNLLNNDKSIRKISDNIVDAIAFQYNFITNENYKKADNYYDFEDKLKESSYDYCKSLVEQMKDKMVFVINKVDKAIYLSTSEVEKYFEIDKSYELINLGFEYLNAENTGRGEQFINDSKKGRIFKEDINSLIKNTINVDTSNGKKKGLFGK
jgi:hypothetical protein